MSIKKVLLASLLLLVPVGCSRNSGEASRQEQEASTKPPMETPPPVVDQQEAQALAEAEPAAPAYREPVAPAPRSQASQPARPSSGTAPRQQPRQTQEPARESAASDWESDQDSVVVPPSPTRRADGTSSQADSSWRNETPAAPAVPARPATAVLQQGTIIDVRLTQALNSGVNKEGDAFSGTLERDLVVNGQTVARRGSRVSGKVVDVEGSGKVQGLAKMTLALTSIQAGEDRYNLETNSLNFEAENTKARDAKVVGSGAAVGAAIGAIAGGKKGAAIGAAVGGGAGTAGVLATKGKEVDFQPEHKFSFRLERDVEMRVR
jgi:hypothetical protein